MNLNIIEKNRNINLLTITINMIVNRKLLRVIQAQSTSDGAGVKLNRAFSYYVEPLIDPFLMMDNFNSVDPEGYMAGFPWHPHRGIETVTYILNGEIQHEDSTGNTGKISSGDTQWMSAGSGIIHQEMPQLNRDGINGFQIWVNLPADRKMSMPRYKDLKGHNIPESYIEDATFKIITGSLNEESNPAFSIRAETAIFDVNVPPERELSIPIKSGYTSIIYIYEGSIYIGSEHQRIMKNSTAVLDRIGENIFLSTGDSQAKFVLLTGKPLNEPVAWRGPIVMNSWNQIESAYRELNQGTFLKHREVEQI
jgi:redox-sensitive bicupin YhaK (pirin superfamily)